MKANVLLKTQFEEKKNKIYNTVKSKRSSLGGGGGGISFARMFTMHHYRKEPQQGQKIAPVPEVYCEIVESAVNEHI